MSVNSSPSTLPFLKGDGEMADLTRQYPWPTTALGPPDEWSQSLKTTVATMLSSQFPMFLWWGEDLIQFYNDAYRPSLGNPGKHPTALGQRGEDCWPEIWSIIKPLIDQVIFQGKSTWSTNQLIPIYRNNQMENVYWTFGYSPVWTELGEIGVFWSCARKPLMNSSRHRHCYEVRNGFKIWWPRHPWRSPCFEGSSSSLT